MNKACQFDIRFLARGKTFKRLASFKHECLRGAGGADQSGWRAKGAESEASLARACVLPSRRALRCGGSKVQPACPA